MTFFPKCSLTGRHPVLVPGDGNPKLVIHHHEIHENQGAPGHHFGVESGNKDH